MIPNKFPILTFAIALYGTYRGLITTIQSQLTRLVTKVTQALLTHLAQWPNQPKRWCLEVLVDSFGLSLMKMNQLIDIAQPTRLFIVYMITGKLTLKQNLLNALDQYNVVAPSYWMSCILLFNNVKLNKYRNVISLAVLI